MALKTIDENPTISDTIQLNITTTDVDGCLIDPYKVESLTIYYIARDYQKMNYGEYDKILYKSDLLSATEEAEALACESPTNDNISTAKQLREKLESSKITNTIYYKERLPQKIIGNSLNPAWLSTDLENALIEKTEDETGKFVYEWTPDGQTREGDFILCWTWAPNISSATLAAHVFFTLEGDQAVVATLPIHQTVANKYETLLERYLPEMYKETLSDSDLTPQITSDLNLAIAKGFTSLENLANQIIDLLDANVVHQSLLVYLSNIFGIKLKSNDPTLWRKQIKRAVPLFKKKGTLSGLQEAYEQAGMRLDGIKQLWQVISPYTWQESFKVKNSPTFKLERDIITPIDENNFKLYLRREGSDNYIELDKSYVTFNLVDCNYYMTWTGDELSSNSTTLYEGDILRVLYCYKAIPDELEQQVEDYIQSLPLADLRDEADQEYPPKNWNVHVIEEDDVMFDVVVPVRHPFYEPLIFGQIRTEFPYSENIYNMEEYNGSTRDSTDPCYIDRAFKDPCGSCLSSKVVVDIAVEELSNERLTEAQEIFKEYAPFHAVIHSINFAGEFNEFIPSPEETIEMLVLIAGRENIVSGNINSIFHRVMEDGLLDSYKIDREDLADQVTVESGLTGTIYNPYIYLISPDARLNNIGVIPWSHDLEILSPHNHAGNYKIDQINKNTAVINAPVDEPIDETEFTFNLSNFTYTNTSVTITQDTIFKFTDANVDFVELGVKSTWDVENNEDYTGGAWQLDIDGYGFFAIKDVLPDGILILEDDGSLDSVPTSNIDYILCNHLYDEIETSSTGKLTYDHRAIIDLNDEFLEDVSQVAKIGDYIRYDGEDYPIIGFSGNDIYISDYSDGNAAGADIIVVRKLLINKIGYFGYSGIILNGSSDHETDLPIINGQNSPADENLITDDNQFKENYLIKIEDNYYKISYINGNVMHLEGELQNWKTLSAGGTSVEYDILHFAKKEVEIKLNVFDQLDRNGKEILEQTIYNQVDDETAISILSNNNDGPMDVVSQLENVGFTIEWSNGNIEEGEL